MKWHDAIEKVLLAVQSRVAYNEISEISIDEAKRYAATDPLRHVEHGLNNLEEELAKTDVDPEQIIQELENDGEVATDPSLCDGVKADGGRCGASTRHASGYCVHHRNQQDGEDR